MQEEKHKPETKPKPRPRQVLTNLTQQDGNNVVSALIKHDKILDEHLQTLDDKSDKVERKVLELEQQIAQLLHKSEECDAEIARLEKKTAEIADNDKAQEIQKYLAIYERLRNDEKLFKLSCNEELDRLQKELEVHNEISDANKADIAAHFKKYTERFEAGRVELGEISRKVATIKRQIEQVPNRMELREYRLRFSELYNQVSATHRSTKQFFSLYNSLEDTKRYLEKELSLLNSIVDSYQLVSGSASGREDFLKQLQNTHDGMKDTCLKVEKKLQAEKIGVDKLHIEFQKLLDVKVAYEKCLKELEAECKRNDQLLIQCTAMEQQKLLKSTN